MGNDYVLRQRSSSDPLCPLGYRFLVFINDVKSAEEAASKAVRIFGGEKVVHPKVITSIAEYRNSNGHWVSVRGYRVYVPIRRAV